MKPHKHKQIKNNLETGFWGPATAADCSISYLTFCKKGDRVCTEPIGRMAAELKKVILAGDHPTMNPFMDELLKEETNDIEEAIKNFITKSCKLDFYDFDVKQDMIEINIEMRFMMVNILPILEQEEIKLTKAIALSAAFKKDLGEPLA
tara:strand:- start:341 stop:787 length:447 start_codon:yes stop_codon:yes gene_type:complete